MKILAVNAGSSSLKYQLFQMPDQKVICSGIAERIGIDNGIFSMKVKGEKYEETMDIANHSVAVELVLEWMQKYEAIDDLNEIVGVGHRVVHGGEDFSESIIITPEVKQRIHELSEFAPLHNPAHLLGIEGFEKALINAVPVAVFDTAFHQTMPEESYMYATPYQWYEKYTVRKYGFHGTSHMYVSQQAAKFLGKAEDACNVIVCHLGNGASLCAIKQGKSYDTTMGFTPLAGIPMGTRSGDIDPAIIAYMEHKLEMSAAEIVDILNKESGFLGVSEFSSDARDIETAIAQGNPKAKLALDIYVKRIAEFIGAYHVTLGGADIIAFTAGIGENSAYFRKAICNRLSALGITIDDTINEATRGELASISTADSVIPVAVIPTNEELVIVEDTYKFVRDK